MRNAAIALMAAFVCIQAEVASGQNIIANGGFETGQLEPWQGYCSITTVQPHSGNYCASLCDYVVYQTFDPIPLNRLADLSFWYRPVSLDPAVSFGYYEAWIEQKDGTPVIGAVPIRPLTLDWLPMPVELPASGDLLLLGIGFGGFGMCLDDVSLLLNARQVRIDVMPGDQSKEISLRGSGLVPVAILGDDGLDVRDIDVASLRLEGAASAKQGKSGKSFSFDDVNGDSRLDLVVRFAAQDLGIDVGTRYLELAGRFLDGSEFFGTDAVWTGPMPGLDGMALELQAVPEPAGLAAVALGGLLALRRRSRAASWAQRRA